MDKHIKVLQDLITVTLYLQVVLGCVFLVSSDPSWTTDIYSLLINMPLVLFGMSAAHKLIYTRKSS